MRLQDFDDFEKNAKVGDWCFLNDDTYIAIRLGEGEMDMCILPISENAKMLPNQKPWKWDGNKDAPTLSPSILHWGNGGNKPATWHGFLRNGKLVDA